MARTTDLRVRVDNEGCLEIVDPGFDCLDLIRATNDEFRVRHAPLPAFTAPRFLALRSAASGVSPQWTMSASIDSLWQAHEAAMKAWRSGSPSVAKRTGDVSILTLKIAIAQRLLSNCVLCGQRCGVDRTKGERGVCRLGAEAIVAEHFVHIGEEPPINPSLIMSVGGCGLRCRYCQQSPLLDPDRLLGCTLDGSLWNVLDLRGARSLSFVGGNPDESLPAILRFLELAPDGWRLPIVWNTHAYGTPETLRLLEGVVDCYVPDLKYGSDLCARRWSGIADYPQVALETIGRMLAQSVPVFVRILVLPGHVSCCHVPAVEALAALVPRHRLWISVRGQYCPDWRIESTDGAMARRPVPIEIEVIDAAVRAAGLRCVEELDSSAS